MSPSDHHLQMPGVLQAAEDIAATTLTPTALVKASLAAIQKHNPSLNAFGDLYDQQALAQAEIMTREAAEGRLRGPLHGIPFAIKDLFSTAGLRTTRGSLTSLEYVPQRDAPIISRLKAAGAILIGKTATTEFGWTGAGVSRVFGPGRNPWNSQLTSGGSSSGSAIAVAARMVPAALGSDGGGSVRIPASFCGIFAMKGSLGRIPTWPWSATEMLSHAGPMTRTVRDSALLFDLLSGPDPCDHQSLPAPTESFLAACDRPLPELRIAWCPTLFQTQVASEVAAIVGQAVQRIAEQLPVEIEQTSLTWQNPLAVFATLWAGGRGIVYGRALRDRLDLLDPGFAELITRSKDITLADYLNAVHLRAEFAGQVHQFFEDYDLLITPTMPVLPFNASDCAPPLWPEDKRNPVPWASWTPFTWPFNLSGNPAASLPCGFSQSGLPVGMQVIGPRFADARVLQFCAAVEAELPWGHRLPPLARPCSQTCCGGDDHEH